MTGRLASAVLICTTKADSCCVQGTSAGRQYKWILNGVELAGETENSLHITNINESYSGSSLSCLLYTAEDASFVLRNNFKLEFVRHKSEQQQQVPEAQPVKSIVSVRHKSGHKKLPRTKQKVFTCVAEESLPEDPKYIWIDGKLEKSLPSSSIRLAIMSG